MNRVLRLAVAASLGVAASGCSTDSGLTAGKATKRTVEPASETTDTTVAPPATDGRGDGVSLPSVVPPPPTAAPVDVAELEWGDCEGNLLADGVECSTLPVPLDYEAPDGATIDVALIRLPAAGDRVGAILTNPGGPGASGYDFLNGLASRAADILGDELIDQFDLVGFDPRGVDRSGGIRCVDDAWLDAHLYLDPSPETPEEIAALTAQETEFTAACRAALGATVVEYSTESTARDMDLIRAALGDEQISFYGTSYGTFLGGTYATLFPNRVRAMVLDSAYSPVGDDPIESFKTQMVGFEGAFANWVTWCNDNTTCAFNDSTDAGVRWDGLYNSLDAAPLDVGAREVNQAVIRRATIQALYSKATWGMLANALAGAAGGDGTGLLGLADSYFQRDPDGTYSTIQQANAVIDCASGLGGAPVADPAVALAEIKAAAPRFAAVLQVEDLENSCAELTGLVTPAPLVYAGSGPIMVIGGTNDPATPFRWAEKMAGELNASLVTFDGEGHGSVTSSDCVSNLAVRLLLVLEQPPAGTVCAPNPPTEAPSWWTTQPTTVEGLTLMEIEDGGELLGLPGDTYVDFFATDADTAVTIERLRVAYEAAGWTVAGEQDLPLGDDSKQVGLLDDSGNIVVITIIGAASFTNPDVAPLAGLVPTGQGLILRFPPPL